MIMDKVKRNIYAKYKIFGTPEDNTTQIVFDKYSGNLEHSFMIPVSKIQIQKMLKIPFLV